MLSDKQLETPLIDDKANKSVVDDTDTVPRNELNGKVVRSEVAILDESWLPLDPKLFCQVHGPNAPPQ